MPQSTPYFTIPTLLMHTICIAHREILTDRMNSMAAKKQFQEFNGSCQVKLFVYSLGHRELG